MLPGRRFPPEAQGHALSAGITVRDQGISLRRFASWARRFAVVVVATLALGPCIALLSEDSSDDVVARSFAPGDPVAVIAPLPDYVSNGSLWNLDGSGSIGEIVSYTWNITANGVTEMSNATSQVYRFQIPGLYKISLTVVDNTSKSNTAFTAVVAMLDTDQDSLPDRDGRLRPRRVRQSRGVRQGDEPYGQGPASDLRADGQGQLVRSCDPRSDYRLRGPDRYAFPE
jgi:hypothetical protein